MYLLFTIENRYGNDIANMIKEACRNAIERHQEIIDNLKNLIQMDVEYKLLEYIGNSATLSHYDRTPSNNRDYEIDPLDHDNNRIIPKSELKEKLEEEAESCLLNMGNYYVRSRWFLNTKCFDGDEAKTNNFISSLDHVKSSRDLCDLIGEMIGYETIDKEFNNMPQFTDIIMDFLKGRGAEIKRDSLRKTLENRIKQMRDGKIKEEKIKEERKRNTLDFFFRRNQDGIKD